MSLPSTRAAWLQFIKEHGHEQGGMGHFAELLDSYPIKIKKELDPLVLAGYVTMTGKPGPGNGGFKYSLTSLGHRFLNENQDELTEAVEADPVPPTAPASPPAPIPVPQLVRDERFAQPEPKRHVAVSPTMSEPTEPAPADDRPAHPPVPDRAGQGVLVVAAMPSLMTDTLYELLYERFADQITAKELIERMEAKDGDAGATS